MSQNKSVLAFVCILFCRQLKILLNYIISQKYLSLGVSETNRSDIVKKQRKATFQSSVPSSTSADAFTTSSIP